MADLEAIREWLAGNVSPELAVDQLSRIAEALRYLKDFPEIAPIERGAIHRKKVSDAPYLIFYRAERGGVVVLRVRHNREDYL